MTLYIMLQYACSLMYIQLYVHKIKNSAYNIILYIVITKLYILKL